MTARLRGPAIWLAERRWVCRLVSERRLGRRLASRFVAGDDLDAGIRAARTLASHGITAMLDHLGENVDDAEMAGEATDGYVRALKRLHEEPGLDGNISVKLTQLGLDVSPDLCRENMELVLQAASGPHGDTLVMIDMEASPYVDATLDVYTDLRDRYPNVGVCVQASLHRTAADVRCIARPGAVVRMAKGAYLEPADVALTSRSAVRTSFSRLTATLLASGAVVHVATHDPRLIEGARRHARTRSISQSQYEFQMLYGIRRDLQRELVEQGEPVRVYVPYGRHWYPYLTRRLAERPANMWFFLTNLVRGGWGRR